MKYICIVILVAAIAIGSRVAHGIWGFDGRLYFLGACVALYIAADIYSRVAERRLTRDLAQLTPEQQQSLSAADPDMAAFLAPPRPLPWYWRVFDGGLAIALLVGPPVMLSVLRGDKLSWDSEFTGFHLLSVCCGVGLYLWLHTRLQSWLRHRYDSANVA